MISPERIRALQQEPDYNVLENPSPAGLKDFSVFKDSQEEQPYHVVFRISGDSWSWLSCDCPHQGNRLKGRRMCKHPHIVLIKKAKGALS
jgi:hypothetical protein